jgi:hypothetical protein
MLRETASRRLVDAKPGCDDDEAKSAPILSFGGAPMDIPERLPEGKGGELW